MLVTAAARPAFDKFTTDEDGNPLARNILWGMAKLAADLRFKGGAIEAVMTQLVRGISDYASAVAFYHDLPAVLRDHLSTRAARSKALSLLTTKIETLEQEEGAERDFQLRQGREALARCLGPVSQFFQAEVGVRKRGGEAVFKKYSVLPLRSDIKQLPYAAFFHLLASDALQVGSENEAYLLAACWATQSNSTQTNNYGQTSNDVFQRLVGNIRWQHITADFLANSVAHCPFMRKAGCASLASVITAALVQREAPPDYVNNARVRTAPRNRGTAPWDAASIINTGIQLEEVDWLTAQGMMLYKAIGQVNGYPLELAFKRAAGGYGGVGGDGLDINLRVLFPRSLYLGPDAPEPHRAVTNGLDRGVALDCSIAITGWPDPRPVRSFCSGGFAYCWNNAIPLSQAAHGTPYFPYGRCEIELHVRVA